jgi:hypothetical protein
MYVDMAMNQTIELVDSWQWPVVARVPHHHRICGFQRVLYHLVLNRVRYDFSAPRWAHVAN